MDRKLSGKEKVAYRKKFGNLKQGRYSESAGISNRFVILGAVVSLFLVLPLLVNSGIETLETNLRQDVGSGGPATHPENDNQSVLQVYAARTWGPKGLFAVHSWIAMKRQGDEDFEVIQVIGWRQDALGNVLFRERNVPINSWWGNEATCILDLRGEDVESIIDKVDAAIVAYPWKRDYRLFPGPNSNTFVAWIGLQVPEMGLDLPSTAIGKDWRPLENSLGSSASGTGIQASLFGLLGTSIGFEEGLEINILGLNFELDLFDLALEIPLFGRYEIGYLLSYLALWLFIRRWLKRSESRYFYSN